MLLRSYFQDEKKFLHSDWRKIIPSWSGADISKMLPASRRTIFVVEN
jgi:hypothetical protein